MITDRGNPAGRVYATDRAKKLEPAMQALNNQATPRYINKEDQVASSVAGIFAQQRSVLKQQLAKHSKTVFRGDQLSALSAATAAHILASSPDDVSSIEPKLQQLFAAYKEVYESANISKAERTQQFISKHGLVMSPDYCIHTIKDTRRVSGFIRAIDKAISTLLRCGQDKVFIAYPACGPFAPLLLPLLSYYRQQGITGKQLHITFIDLQPGAIKSLHKLMTEMQLQQFVQQMYCGDACDYNAPMLFDMVICEAMQHGFSREGHLAIAQHFANQLSMTGYFIPQQIDVHAMLTVAQKEYVEQWHSEGLDELAIKQKRAHIEDLRTELGIVLSLSASTLTCIDSRQVAQQSLITAGKLKLPELHEQPQKQILCLYTHITLFADEKLSMYDSGITHPLPDLSVCVNFIPKDPKPDDTLAQSGDTLSFFYSMSGLPGFIVTKSCHNE
ncbi:hypothetical protein WNE01_09545 [Pseudoalteromonas sp. YIC-468]